MNLNPLSNPYSEEAQQNGTLGSSHMFALWLSLVGALPLVPMSHSYSPAKVSSCVDACLVRLARNGPAAEICKTNPEV